MFAATFVDGRPGDWKWRVVDLDDDEKVLIKSKRGEVFPTYGSALKAAGQAALNKLDLRIEDCDYFAEARTYLDKAARPYVYGYDETLGSEFKIWLGPSVATVKQAARLAKEWAAREEIILAE